MPQPTEENVVIDAEALKAISDAVVAGVTPVIEEKVKAAVDAKVVETPVVKNVSTKGDEEEESDEEVEVVETKQMGFVKAAIALQNGNKAALKAYNERTLQLRTKAGYANSDVNADGGYIVADPEFEAEIERLSDEYGIAFREANVVTINGNSIKTNKRGSNVRMYETGQGVPKRGTKLVIEQVTVELRKFAAIAVATDELVEDAAIDFWNEVAQGFAEERARIADELVFSDTNETYPGILHTDGVNVVSVGANITSITWDDLMDAEALVPTVAARNGKHYMHRTVWNALRQGKDDEGRYMLMPTAGLQTPWGTPVVLTDALPSTSEVADANEGYTVFGDLKRVKLYVKRGLVLEQSNEATVEDADGNEVHLYEQDMTALRAVSRMVALVKFPNAFTVIGTGTVS